MAIPAFVLHRNGKVVLWNTACERLTGIAASDMIGTADHWKGFYRRRDRASPIWPSAMIRNSSPVCMQRSRGRWTGRTCGPRTGASCPPADDAIFSSMCVRSWTKAARSSLWSKRCRTGPSRKMRPVGRDEQHGERRRRPEGGRVAPGGELVDVRAQLPRVHGHPLGADRLVVGLHRLDVPGERHLRVDDTCLPSARVTTRSGRTPAPASLAAAAARRSRSAPAGRPPRPRGAAAPRPSVRARAACAGR